MLSSIPTPTPQVNCGHWKVTNLNWPFSHRPACWSWPPAAAPGGGRSSEPPGGCRSVYAPSPTVPIAALSRPYHPAHRRLHRVWRYSSRIALEACDGIKDHQNNFQKDRDSCDSYYLLVWFTVSWVRERGKVYPDDDAEVEDLIDDVVLSPAWWTFGEEGAEDSGVAISSMSEYSPDLEPFLLKALLKELRNCTEKKHETEQMMRLKTLN